MTIREYNNKIKTLEQQLELMILYEKDFLAKLGKTGYQSLIDQTLDDINFYKYERQKALDKLNKKK
jgi:hypothetical protein